MSAMSTGHPALLQAYREHEQALLKFLLKRVKCPVKAADLAHDLCLKLLRGEGLGPISNVRAYLFQSAANLATDYLRLESRRADLLKEVQRFLWTQEGVPTPERIIMARHQVQAVREVIQGLPPLTRQIFYLSRFEEQSYQEIAAALKISTTEVETQLRRVLRQVRAVLRRR
jgi:RNA polymerase sigma factor (sigma-70 family)